MAKAKSEPPTIEGVATESSQALQKQERSTPARRVPATHLDPFMTIIERAITTPNFEVSKLEQLLAVRKQWEHDQAVKAYTVAINKFKQNPPTITKNRTVGFDSKKTGDSVSYSHATLDQVCDAVIQGLSSVGISHKWRTEQPEGRVRVTCVLRHELGGTDEATLEGPPDTSGTKNMIQAIGSTVTYLERYTLLAVTGLAVAGTDTDGTSRPSLEEIICPACGNAGAVIKGKEEYGGGFVCWKGKNGCGATFEHLPGSEGEQAAGESGKVPEFKQNKFAGTVESVRRVPAGENREVLLLKLQWNVKKKGKNNKWSTIKEEGIIVVEETSFMRLLEGSTGTKIEVMCSQRPANAGKTYWRIEKLLKGGSEPPKPAGEAKQAPAEKKPAAGEAKSPNPMMPCYDCAHPAGIHTYGTDGCTSPNCPCKKFTVGPAGPATAPAAAKPASTPASGPAPQPASSAAQPAPSTVPPPIMSKVQRTLTVGGKKQTVEWMQLRGKITGLAPAQKTAKGSLYMTVCIAGLPDGSVLENRKKLHDVFYLRHKHLFEALGTAKVGDTIVFCFEQETTKEGIVWANLEDIEWIGGMEFMNGKPVMPGYGQVPPP